MVKEKLHLVWQALRQLSGDDRYELYLQHHAQHHPDQPLQSRVEFFKQWQDDKWQGVKRCC
jgi:uncharacterized short protein YbdD (DUF466 family)